MQKTILSTWSTGAASGDLIVKIPQANILQASTIAIGQEERTTQMVTASNTNVDGTHFGFLLSGSLTTGSVIATTGSHIPSSSDSCFVLPFSEDELDANGDILGTALPDSAKLSLGGPQLALFHAYNSLIASESIQPATLLCNQFSQSEAWILEGQDPANPNNYWQWKPSASDCSAYQDDGEAFLIQRGDVLRVEGIKSYHSMTVSNLTSSISFIEDFTVMEMQNYYYTASGFYPGGGFLVPTTIADPISSSPVEHFASYPGYRLGLLTDYGSTTSRKSIRVYSYSK